MYNEEIVKLFKFLEKIGYQRVHGSVWRKGNSLIRMSADQEEYHVVIDRLIRRGSSNSVWRIRALRVPTAEISFLIEEIAQVLQENGDI